MSASRLTALLAALVLAAPASAFAQGAGDDQYQDPFPDAPAQTQPDDGLSDEPPVAGGSSAGGSGSAGAGSGGEDTAPAPASPAPAADAQLPRTGAEPLWLALLGAAFLLIGAGLRLRTIDPDAF